MKKHMLFKDLIRVDLTHFIRHIISILWRKFNDVIPDVLDKNHMANPDSNTSFGYTNLKIILIYQCYLP